MAIIFKLRRDLTTEFDIVYDGAVNNQTDEVIGNVLQLGVGGIDDLFQAFLKLGDSGNGDIISHRIMSTRGRDVKLISIDPITNTPIQLDKSGFVADVFASQKFYVSSTSMTMDESPDLVKLYRDCAMLPYPIVFLEIFGHGVLVKKTPTGFTTNLVLPDGSSGVVSSVVTLTDSDVVVSMNPSLEYLLNLADMVKMHVPVEQLIREFVGMLISQIVFVLRALLFINTKNITQHTIKPTRKELGSVAKVMVPKYIFKVIDIIRGQPQDMTLSEFKDHRRNSANALGKTTMVSGHFKRRKTGVYWWNHFVRNARNKTTAGEVIKDYRLIAK